MRTRQKAFTVVRSRAVSDDQHVMMDLGITQAPAGGSSGAFKKMSFVMDVDVEVMR